MPDSTAALAGDRALKREIGPLGVAAFTLNIVMGLGLFVLPAPIAKLGPWAPLAILACGLVMAAVTLCFAEASSRVPASGGAYGFVREGLGPIVAPIVGGMIWVSGTCAASAILAAAIDQLVPFAPWAAGGGARAGLIVCLCGAFALVAMAGARQSSQAVEVTMALKLLPLLLFIGVVAFGPVASAPPPPAPAAVLDALGPTLILGIYLFAGLESATVTNGEVRDPARTLPQGLLIALAVFAVLAIAIQVVAARALGADLPDSAAPLVAAAARTNGWLPVVIAGAAVVSMLGSAGGLAIAMPRATFAFANDRLLPAFLGRVHAVRRTPTAAITFHALVVIGLAVSGEFRPLAQAASLASMAVYVLGCAAALALRKRGVEQAGQVLAWRIVPAAAVIGIIANLAIIASASVEEIAGLAAGGLLFALLGWWRRPAAMATP